MNKEQFRKELEDAMRFDNDNEGVTGQEWQEMKESYITTRLAALDDGDGEVGKLKLQVRRLRRVLSTMKEEMVLGGNWKDARQFIDEILNDVPEPKID